MIEKLIVLEDIDPVIFYGVNNANIQLIKALYPKLRIVARGNVIKVLGDEEEMCAFEENITKLEKYCAEYNSLKEEVIIDIIKGNAPQAEQTGNVNKITNSNHMMKRVKQIHENPIEPIDIKHESKKFYDLTRITFLKTLYQFNSQ